MNHNFVITGIEAGDTSAFCSCLTPGDLAEDAGIKRKWLEGRNPDNFGAKIAKAEDGKPVGMIQYVPIGESAAMGDKLWFVYCIWIPPRKRNQGRQMRGKGIGKALLEAAENDVRAKGAEGLAVWGTPLPFFMRSSWFRKQGYEPCDKIGIQQLLWKRFTEQAKAPQWRRNPAPVPTQGSGNIKADIVVFSQGICPAMNMTRNRFERAAEVFAPDASFRIIDVSNGDQIREWGRTDAFYLNNKEFPAGPPPSYKKIEKAIKKEIKRR